MGSVTLTVAVPSYGRPDRLAECLAGLRRQSVPPQEVLPVVHAEDRPSVALAEAEARRWRVVRPVIVERPGTIAAMNAGLAAATGTYVAYCDDDAVPREDWAQRIVDAFERDPELAGIGGRDVIHRDGSIIGAEPIGRWSRLLGAPQVGRIQWWGRMLGNHHRHDTRACDTDVLKGCNMAFRRSEVQAHGFDARLRGDGAVVHSELSICLPLRRRGRRLAYDPAIVVDHYPAPRRRGDHREDARPAVILANTHNEALQILDYLEPPRQAAFLAWGIVVGTGLSPGVAVFARDLLGGRADVGWPRFLAALRGRAAAWHTHRTQPRPAIGR